VLYEVPVPVRSLRPEVSAETGYLVERMMLRDAALRYHARAGRRRPRPPAQGASILRQVAGNWRRSSCASRCGRPRSSSRASRRLVAGLEAHTDWREDERQTRAFATKWAFERQHVNPLSTSDDVERELTRKELLLAEAKRIGAPEAAELALEVGRLREEQGRYVELNRVVQGTVAGLERDGQFAAAQAALRGFYERSKGVAKQEAGARLGRLADASDAALVREARQRFPSTPRDVEDLAARAEEWATKVVGTFARSGAQALAAERAERASVAAQRIRAKVAEMQAEVSEDVVERAA
jgi:hypothetical protein